MGRLRYRQVILLLVVLILPTIAIGLQSRWIVNQEMKNKEASEEKSLLENQKTHAAQIGRDLLARLDRLKFQEANGPAAMPQPGKYSDPAVVLVGRVVDDQLVWPWDDDATAASPTPASDEVAEAAYVRKKKEAENAEFIEKDFGRAAGLYRGVIEAAQTDTHRADAQLALARMLVQSGSQAEGIAAYRTLLNLPWSVTDGPAPYGIPYATHAAQKLAQLTPGRDVLNRVLRDLDSPNVLRTNEANELKSVLERLQKSFDPSIRRESGTALQHLATRIHDLERARNLQEARDLKREFAGLRVTDSDWKPYTGPNNDLWLVGKTPAPGGNVSSPLAVVIRAEPIAEILEQSRTANGGPTFRIVAGGNEGQPLGEHLSTLRVVFTSPGDAAVVSDSHLQYSLYALSLYFVVPLTLLGGFLLWRDTRRETRVAEMRSQFVSSVSHELKTPLTSIRMFAETLQMADETDSSDKEVRQEYLDTIVSESERLTRLLNNVLDFSRIERGQKSYHMENADLPEVLDAALRTMRFPLSEQGFDLKVDVCEGLPQFQMDRDAIEQAILNLLSNAMKYSGKNKEILLRLSRQNGNALIQVTDHGIGIPISEQRRIFDRFYRVPSKENRAISGTGLGLALVTHIVQAHGGSVEVQSVQGEGSTFSLRIPMHTNGHGNTNRKANSNGSSNS